MTFIALGVFDKVKNISITDVTKKLKDYVVRLSIFSMLLLIKMIITSKSKMFYRRNL